MFSDRLKSARKAKKITQEQLAKMISVERSSVGKYESANVIPSPEVLKRIADSLDVSIDYLLGRETKKVPGPQYDGETNVITIAARDGGVIERKLSDDQLSALKAILDQMPDADDDNL